MSGLVVPQVPFGLTMEEYAEIIAKALKEIDWAFNGNISDQNISRIANFVASKTELKHISGIVGMSGYDAGNDLAVRLWAGNADKSIGPWRVLQNGYMYSTRGFIGGWDIDTDRLSGTGTIEGGTIIGSEIMTALAGVYPRSAMSTTGNLFIAEQSADTFIKIMANYLDGVALLIENATVNGLIGPVGDVLLINTAHTHGGIQISSGGDLELYADILDSSKVVKVNAWNRFVNKATGNNLQYELSQLQSQIDSKQDVFVGGDIVVIDDEAYLTATGIGAGTYTKITINTQGRATAGTTLASSDIPTLAQSKITNLVTDLADKASKTQQAWQPITLQNSWANVGGNYFNAGYYKDEFGIVHLRGLIASGTTTVGTTIFTLGAGYRTTLYQLISTISNNGGILPTLIEVHNDGTWNIGGSGAGNIYFCLDNISFRADS